MSKTLAASMKSESIDFEILHKNYHPVLALVKELIGLVPNCDPILEIWPTGFKTYNLLVPNMFNLPNTLWGKKSFKADMGLAMFTSSMAASCPYCSAHTCSFALRRGASLDAIKGNRTPKEKAVVNMAEGLSKIPAEFTREHYMSMTQYFSKSEIESIAFSISMMGFLNKFMDAMGIELEQESINDVGELLTKVGWVAGKHVNGEMKVTKSTVPKTDNLLTYLRVIKQAPGAVSLEKKWMHGVPDIWPEAGNFLMGKIGHNFPILRHISQKRVVKAITTVLRDNLDKNSSAIGLENKYLVGYVFACKVFNENLKAELKNIAYDFASKSSGSLFLSIELLVLKPIPTNIVSCKELLEEIKLTMGINDESASAILLSLASSPSPAEVNDTVIESITEYLNAESIVEIVVWISVLQLLHRLGNFYSTEQKINTN